MVLQKEVDVTYPDALFDRLHLGLITSDDWIVTELGEAKCEGFEGALLKKIIIGDTYRYAHLSGKDAKLRTLELHDGKLEAYEGTWLSPFDIGKVES